MTDRIAMMDNESDGAWLSANEAVVKFSVTKPHFYVLASRKRWQNRVWNDGIKRYHIPNSYERHTKQTPNIHFTVPNNSAEANSDIQDLLYKQLLDAREELRQVEVQRLEEQVLILQEDKKYLRDKLDDVYGELPKILAQIGRLQSERDTDKKEIEALKYLNKNINDQLYDYKNIFKSIYKKLTFKR